MAKGLVSLGRRQPLRTSPLQLAQCAAPADAKVGARLQPRRHRRRDSLLPRRRSPDPELRPYPLHLFRLLSTLSCSWETLFLLPRWVACLLTVGDFSFLGDRAQSHAVVWPATLFSPSVGLQYLWPREGWEACAPSEVSDLSVSN